MKVTLIAIHPDHSAQSIALGNAFLKAYASGKTALEITLIDFTLKDDSISCARSIVANEPTAVGFSMYLWNRGHCIEIASKLKETLPNLILFCGGPEVSADPQSVLKCPVFDFVVSGEGEIPFLKLCEALERGADFRTIPGIIVKGDNKPATQDYFADPDSVQSPYLSGIIDTEKHQGILWQLSRGCSFSCDFCFDSRGLSGVRRFSLDRIEAELQHFASSKISQIFVLDSTFNIDKKRAKKILRLIRKIAPHIHFHFEVRHEFIDREMAELFAQIPCSLQIGLQSADIKVLENVRRNFDPALFKTNVDLLNKSGAVFGFDIIYGLPGDSLSGFYSTIDYALSLYPNHLDIFQLAVLPGTKLADRASELNIHASSNPPYLLAFSDTFSSEDLEQAAIIAAATDLFYTRGKCVAWFNAVAKLLSYKPSRLLQTFAEWLPGVKRSRLNEADYSDSQIKEIIEQFIEHILKTDKMSRYLPIVIDLIRYHYHYASALLAENLVLEELEFIPARLTSMQLCLAESVQLVDFNYDIDELLASGEPDIVWISKNLRKSSSHAVIYLHRGEVCTVPLDVGYMQLLRQISECGRVTGDNCGSLSEFDTQEFLEYAVNEGIVTLYDRRM